MVYKIYKKVKGKKHGPYFYKTVRTAEGKIKTIYLGKTKEEALKREAELLKKGQKKTKKGIRTVRILRHDKRMLYWIMVPVLAIIIAGFFLYTIPTSVTIKPIIEIKTQSGIPGTYELTETLEGNYNLKVFSTPVEPEKPKPEMEIREIESPPEKIESKIDSYSGTQPERGKINTPVVAVKQELTFKEATITLPKTGPVNTIVYCPDFNFETFTCPAWEKTRIPFQETADTISFRATRFSAYGGALIEISKAEHLDENRTLISDIYEQVKALDSIWSEPIYHNEYVRITFKQALDNTRDITIYARSNASADIEVYRENDDNLITKFENIAGENWYKVYLTNLAEGESYDVFDLKIIGDNQAGVEFDYIVDPPANESDTVYRCGTLDSPGTYTMNQSIINNTLTGDCIIITSQNVTLDCAGYYISSSSSESGIYSNQFNTTIKNCNITMGFVGTGIEFSNVNNSFITNSTLNSNYNGIILFDSSYNKITEMIIDDSTGDAIGLSSASSNIFENINIDTDDDAGGTGVIRITGSSKHNIFKETNIITMQAPVGISNSDSTNNTFLNCSYYGQETITQGELIRKWYYRAYVNDTAGNNVSNANVTAFNVSDDYQFNLTTGSNGYTSLGEIIDYVNNGTRIYYSLYNIYASNSSYQTVNHTYNVTANENNYKDVFILTETGTNVTICRTLDQANTEYTQQADIVADANPCINITAENITFDGNGFWIANSGLDGIGIYSNQLNTTIKNCNVSMGTGSGGYGIKLGGAVATMDNSYIYNNTLSNQEIGLFLQAVVTSTKNIKIEKITANNNSLDGIHVSATVSAGNISMINITANNNSQYGIYLSSSSNSSLTNITANSNNDHGVYLSSSSNNTLTNITANSNNDHGVYLSSSSNNNNLTNITANSNEDYGVYLASSSNNNLTDITANNNSWYGICLASSSNNNLTDITANSNLYYGAYLSSSSNNILTNNILNSNNLSGIYLASSSNNTLTNNNIWNCSHASIYIFESDYNVFDENKINKSSNYGIFIYSSGPGANENSDHNLFKNTNMTNIDNTSVFLDDDGSDSENLNNTFLNFTYKNESVNSRSELIRKWYYRAYVNDTNGNNVNNANVTAYNVSDDYQFNLTTGSNGYTSIGEIIDYINTGTRSYYSNYTIYATNDSYPTSSHTYNVTFEENNLKHVFTLDNVAPTITIINPVNNSNFNQSSVTFNVSLNEAGSWCGLSISGAANQTMSGSGTAFGYTNTSIADGSYNFIVSCNDTLNNYGASSTYYFYIDTVYPLINFTNPTLGSGSTTENDWLFVNVSASDSASSISTFIDFDNSLVGWWRMDDVSGTGEGATVYDNTSYGNDGTAYNQAAQSDSGKLGKSFEFDGDEDYIEVPHSNSLNVSSSFTVAVWVYIDQHKNYNSFVGKTGDTSKNRPAPFDMWVYGSGVMRCNVGDGTNWNWTGASLGDAGNWKHIVCWWNGSDIKLYVNADLKDSVTPTNLPSGAVDKGQVLRIGRRTDAESVEMDGLIDDVMIFNRSLSAEEIRGLYANKSSEYLTHNFTSLAEGSHKFKAYTQDYGGNVNSTEKRTVTVDITGPTITIDDPANGTYWNTGLTINGTTEDLHKDSCYTNDSTYFGGIIDVSTTGVFNFTNTSTLTEGTYIVLVSCNDSANNTNSSIVYFTYDITKPLVSFGTSPVDNYNISSQSIIFDLKCSDNFNVSYLQLWGNWSGWHANQTNSSPYNDTYWNKTVDGIPEGIWKWGIYCNDTAGNNNWSDSNRTFTVDTTPPNVIITSPSNISYPNNTIYFNITVSELYPDVCLVEILSTNHSMTKESGNWWYYNDTLINGSYQAKYFCNDSAGNVNNTESIYFTIDEIIPSIIINTPVSGQYFNYAPYINGTVTETNLDTIKTNVTEYDSLDITSPFNFSNTTILSEGRLDVNVSANDTAGNIGFDTVYFYYDITDPTASMGTNPIDYYNDSDGSITFDLKCSDNFNVSYLQLWGNWSGWHANQTNSSPINNTYWNKTVDGIPDGVWKWGIYCNDTAGNNNWSDSNRTFTVDTTPPILTNAQRNESLSNSVIKLNMSVTDNIMGVNTVLFEVNSTNYTHTGNTGDDYYYNWDCQVQGSGNYYWNITYANDTLDNMNSTTGQGLPLWFECDIDNPSVTDAEINSTSTIEVYSIIKVNATITESNPDTVLIEMTKPDMSTENLTTANTGSEYYNATINLTQLGNYSFKFFANDTFGYTNFTVNALTSDSKINITVKDTTNPAIGNKFINETGPVNPNTIVCLNVSGISDNFQLDKVWAVITQSNGSTLNKTMLDTGNCAGGSNDGWYSVDINVGNSAGTFYYNASYVNDTSGNKNSNLTIQSLTVQIDTPPSIGTPQMNVTNNSVVANGTSVKMNASITDNNAVNTAFFTINTVNYTTTNTSDDWYNITQCLSSGWYNWTNIWANDTANQWSSQSVDLRWQCDANAPLAENATNNASGSRPLNTPANITCDFEDLEGNLNQTWLQIDRPISPDTNESMTQLSGNKYNKTIILDETGTWNFICWANDTANQLNSTSVPSSYIVWLNVTLITPTPGQTTNKNRYQFFWVNATAECIGTGGNCGEINGTARYNNTGTEPDQVIQSSGTPFTTTDNQPQSCGELTGGQSCQLNWSVNATGTIDSTYKIDVNFTTNESSCVNNNDTTNAIVRITDTTPPQITDQYLNTTDININQSIRLNATTSDPESDVTAVNFTMQYPNGTSTNLSATEGPDNYWELNFSGTNLRGEYNWTYTYALSSGGLNSTAPNNKFNVSDLTNVSEVSLNTTDVNRPGAVLIQATLINSTQDGIEGQTISFYNDSDLIGTNTTNSTGNAIYTWNIPSDTSLGIHTINITYSGNTSQFYRSSYNDTQTLTVWATTNIPTVDINDTTPTQGDIVLIQAQLKYDNGTTIENQNISFYRNETPIDQNKTNSTGWAILLFDTAGLLGNYTINASYSENSTIYTRASYNDTRSIDIQPIDNPPNVTLNSPGNNTWNTSQTITFGFIPTDDFGFANCSLWTNETSWGLKKTNTSTIQNDSVNYITETFGSDGTYIWNIQCYDTSSQPNFSSANWTIKIDSTPPTITIDAPANGTYWNTVPTINGTCNDNIALNTSYTNSTYFTGIDTSPAIFNFTNTTALPNGRLDVLVYCNDSTNNTVWTWVYFTFDDTPPTWTGNKTNGSDSTEAGEYVYFNITLNDNIAGNYSIFSIDDGVGTFTNQTPRAWSSGDELEEIVQITATVDQVVRWKWYFNDSARNWNETDTWSFISAGLPPLPPVVNAVNATPNVEGFGKNITLYANVTDPNWQADIDTVWVNVTAPNGSSYNLTMSNYSLYIWEVNYTDYVNGTYNFTVYVNDTKGLIGPTNSSTFDLYINLTINIQTAKDVYDPGNWVNISSSNITNNGPTNVSVYLLMNVQYWSAGSGWVFEYNVLDDTSPRSITAGETLSIDSLWNTSQAQGGWNVSTRTHGDGTYRAYIAITDPADNVLVMVDGSSAEAGWNFSINNTVPSVYEPKVYRNGEETIKVQTGLEIDIRVNVTDVNGRQDITTVLLKLTDSKGSVILNNVTMTNITDIEGGRTYNYTYNIPSDAEIGTWTATVYAGDLEGLWGQNSTSFGVVADYTIQVRLKINNTVNKVYIPGTGERAFSEITNTSYTSPVHYYLASYLNDVLKSLVFAYQEPVSIDTERSGATHTLEIDQYITNSKLFLVFTKGDRTTIENRIGLIEAGTFLLNIAPSFAYGLGLYHPVKIILTYPDVNLQGNVILQKGTRTLVLEGVGDLEGKHVINLSVI